MLSFFLYKNEICNFKIKSIEFKQINSLLLLFAYYNFLTVLDKTRQQVY